MPSIVIVDFATSMPDPLAKCTFNPYEVRAIVYVVVVSTCVDSIGEIISHEFVRKKSRIIIIARTLKLSFKRITRIV